MTSSLGHHHIPYHHICHCTSSTMPCHSIISSTYHHICHATSSTMPCHAIIFSISSSMPCHHYLCLSLSLSYHRIFGYSFVIIELLWHQWQLYSQHTSDKGWPLTQSCCAIKYYNAIEGANVVDTLVTIPLESAHANSHNYLAWYCYNEASIV